MVGPRELQELWTCVYQASRLLLVAKSRVPSLQTARLTQKSPMRNIDLQWQPGNSRARRGGRGLKFTWRASCSAKKKTSARPLLFGETRLFGETTHHLVKRDFCDLDPRTRNSRTKVACANVRRSEELRLPDGLRSVVALAAPQAVDVIVQLPQFARLDLFVGAVCNADVLQPGSQTLTLVTSPCR